MRQSLARRGGKTSGYMEFTVAEPWETWSSAKDPYQDLGISGRPSTHLHTPITRRRTRRSLPSREDVLGHSRRKARHQPPDEALDLRPAMSLCPSAPLADRRHRTLLSLSLSLRLSGCSACSSVPLFLCSRGPVFLCSFAMPAPSPTKPADAACLDTHTHAPPAPCTH